MTRARRDDAISTLEWASVTIGAAAALGAGAYLLVFHLRDLVAWLLFGPLLAVLR